MDEREKLQKQAVDLIKETGKVVLRWATSMGKSKAAINIINDLSDNCFKYSEEALSVLLVVNERAHILNWQEEFKKFPIKTDNIKICCYASLKNYIDYYDLVILDEAHNVTSELRLSSLSRIRFGYLLLLSATIKDSQIDSINEVVGEAPFTVSTITLQNGIDHKILSRPHIYTIPLLLDNEIKNQTITIAWGTKNHIIKCTYSSRYKYIMNRSKYPNSKVIIECTEQEKYNYITEQCNYWDRMSRSNSRARLKYLRTCLDRKQFLGEIKTKIVSSFLSQFKLERFICFCISINQAKKLSSNNSIYSGKAGSISLIKDFNSGKINSLFAINMLREGQNLTNIKNEVMVQLDGSEGPFIQKFGRVLRATSPNLYIFYYKYTRDEEYLKNVLEGINSSYIKEMSFY